MTELNRLSRDGRLRSFWQVLAVYIGASWVVLQVVDVVKDNMGLPDWVFPSALILLLIGLPIMLGTAIIQGRLTAPDSAPTDSSPAVPAAQPEADLSPRRFFTWRNALIGGAAAFVLLTVVTTGFMFMRNRGIGPVGSLVARGVLDERGKVILADFEASDPEIARAFDRAGMADSAIARFELSLDYGNAFDLWSTTRQISTTLLRLAQLFDEQGDLERAAGYYGRFVELWADADPELQPRVEAARARLEEIVRERG